MGKYPKKLAEKREHLMKVMDAYGQYYVSYRKFLVRLYLVDPMQHSVFNSGKYKGGFTETLFMMSIDINKNKEVKKIEKKYNLKIIHVKKMIIACTRFTTKTYNENIKWKMAKKWRLCLGFN